MGNFEVTRLIQHVKNFYLNEKVFTNTIQLIWI